MVVWLYSFNSLCHICFICLYYLLLYNSSTFSTVWFLCYVYSMSLLFHFIWHKWPITSNAFVSSLIALIVFIWVSILSTCHIYHICQIYGWCKVLSVTFAFFFNYLLDIFDLTHHTWIFIIFVFFNIIWVNTVLYLINILLPFVRHYWY